MRRMEGAAFIEEDAASPPLWEIRQVSTGKTVALLEAAAHGIATYTVGRMEADIIVSDKGVSRQHAKLSLHTDGSRLVLVDMRSKFGTLVNGRSIGIGVEVSLSDRDELSQGVQALEMAALESIVGPDDIWGRIELRMTADESEIFQLKGDSSQVVGRALGADIHVNLPHISATHCTLRPSGVSEEGQYCVKIMDSSSNGTCLNANPIGRNKEKPLVDGDTLSIPRCGSNLGMHPSVDRRPVRTHACCPPCSGQPSPSWWARSPSTRGWSSHLPPPSPAGRMGAGTRTGAGC